MEPEIIIKRMVGEYSSSVTDSSVCRTLTKIWPKNIDFYRYSYNVRERAVQRAVFAPPPFTPGSD